MVVLIAAKEHWHQLVIKVSSWLLIGEIKFHAVHASDFGH